MECGLSPSLAHCGHMGSMESLELVHLIFGNVLTLPLLFLYFLSQSNFPVSCTPSAINLHACQFSQHPSGKSDVDERSSETNWVLVWTWQVSGTIWSPAEAQRFLQCTRQDLYQYMAGDRNRVVFKDPSNIRNSMILWFSDCVLCICASINYYLKNSSTLKKYIFYKDLYYISF